MIQEATIVSGLLGDSDIDSDGDSDSDIDSADTRLQMREKNIWSINSVLFMLKFSAGKLLLTNFNWKSFLTKYSNFAGMFQ